MNRKNFYETVIILCGIISAFLLYFSLLLGKNSSIYYYGLFLIVPFAITAYYAFIKRSDIILLENVQRQWGKKNTRKRNFKEISGLFGFTSRLSTDRFIIDDQTWEDLNMDEVYALIDRTHTTPGEHVLYKILRFPEFNSSVLHKRNTVIRLFQDDIKLRESVEVKLEKLGRQKGISALSLLWDELPGRTYFKELSFLLFAAAVLSLVSIAFIGPKALVYYVIPVMAINSFVHYKAREKIFGELNFIRYISGIIRAAEKLIGITRDYEELKEHTEKLRKDVQKCKSISNKTSMLRTDNSNDPIYEYFNLFFLMEARSFFSALDEIKAHLEELRDLYNTLGEIDSLISVASYRKSLYSYVEPELSAVGCYIKAKGIVHPLIQDCVSNSIAIDHEGILVTGSNMSGKSTFLRTLGVNALFAQTIFTCTASHYTGSFFRVITSISRNDNLTGGKSYYLAEAEALLRIIRASEEGSVPCFCILDEMFRGTNSVERISAAAEILGYLVQHNTITILATHDLELTDMVGERYSCYYFSESVGQEGLNFDYHIKPGVSQNRNAVKLMKYLGYPDEIVSNTTERVQEMLKA